MADLLYVSASDLASSEANVVHVICQCAALADLGKYDRIIVVGANSKFQDKHRLIHYLSDQFGLCLSNIEFVCVENGRIRNFRIAVRGIFTALSNHNEPCVIISRNLYFSFFSKFLSKPQIFEAHGFEYDWRYFLLRSIYKSVSVNIVCISSALENLFKANFGGRSNIWVLADATNSLKIFPEKIPNRSRLKVGYFGSLYRGRGLEIMCAIVKRLPNIDFFIYGGNRDEISDDLDLNNLGNLFYSEKISHSQARIKMMDMDILLMPYQNSVGIGGKSNSCSDSSQWMSPLKMFEYMASGAAIISSDLPVLREVLVHRHNGLLVPPESVSAWVDSINELSNDPNLRVALAKNAFEKIRRDSTWAIRAQRLSKILDGVYANLVGNTKG